MNLYQEIFTELAEAEIEYLIVGGVAVNLYGYSRFTGGIDILLALDKENLEKFEKLMHKIGYTERQPISIKELSKGKKLEEFVKEKGMLAFTFLSSSKPQLDIDILTQESTGFREYALRKNVVEVWGLSLPVVDVDDLIEMKKSAARDKDKIDIEALLKLKGM